MSSLHDPAASAAAGLRWFRVCFFSSLLDMRLVAMGQGGFLRQGSFVTRVGAEMLPPPGEWAPVRVSPRPPASLPVTSHHARWPRSRRAIAGRHARRLINCACVLFFPDPWGSRVALTCLLGLRYLLCERCNLCYKHEFSRVRGQGDREENAYCLRAFDCSNQKQRRCIWR